MDPASSQLERASDEELLRRLAASSLRDRGHALLSVGSRRIFVKLVPITARELLPRNRHATANLFGLPTVYQYRIGSCGFGAWRELAAHQLTDAWAGAGHPGFPRLVHWRILPIVGRSHDDKTSLAPWGDDPAIRDRVAAVRGASSSLVLFLEAIPLPLGRWLGEQLPQHPAPLALVTDVEAQLRALLAFTRSRGLLHMDAHFDNILTDGQRLVLTDFGLALSQTFALGPDERRFFADHQGFDLCTALTSLVHAIVTHFVPAADWRASLQALEAVTMPAALRRFLARRTPLVMATGALYRRLLSDVTTPYPAEAFGALLDELGDDHD